MLSAIGGVLGCSLRPSVSMGLISEYTPLVCGAQEDCGEGFQLNEAQ